MIGNSIQFNWLSSYFIQIQFLQIANQAPSQKKKKKEKKEEDS